MSHSATGAPARPTDAAALRGDEATLFATHSGTLERAVRRAVDGPDALVEDACQCAWAILLRAQPDRATAFAWLLTVAIHEAWRLSAADRRSCPLTRRDDTALDGLKLATPTRTRPCGRSRACTRSRGFAPWRTSCRSGSVA
jgi:hypothetical protein